MNVKRTKQIFAASKEEKELIIKHRADEKWLKEHCPSMIVGKKRRFYEFEHRLLRKIYNWSFASFFI